MSTSNKSDLLTNLMGAAGVVGQLVTVFVKLPGKFAVPVGLISAVFILLWGWFERKNARTYFKALAWLGVGVGAMLFAAFAGIGLLLLQGSGRFWAERQQVDEVKMFRLAGDAAAPRLNGSYKLELSRASDVAEVGLMPDPEQAQMVDRITVLSVSGAPAHLGRVVELGDKRTPHNIFYEVSGPSPDLNVVLSLRADLKPPADARALTMRAYYKYGVRDSLWRLREWAHTRYGD